MSCRANHGVLQLFINEGDKHGRKGLRPTLNICRSNAIPVKGYPMCNTSVLRPSASSHEPTVVLTATFRRKCYLPCKSKGKSSHWRPSLVALKRGLSSVNRGNLKLEPPLYPRGNSRAVFIGLTKPKAKVQCIASARWLVTLAFRLLQNSRERKDWDCGLREGTSSSRTALKSSNRQFISYSD